MKKVGITGQAGFIGSHLYNYLSLNPWKENETLEEIHKFENEGKNNYEKHFKKQ